jgi:signal transduction histidine kinase
MIANVSHEFRTPLNAIISSENMNEIKIRELKVAVEKKQWKKVALLVEPIAKNVKTSKVSSKLLLSLVNDILDLARIENEAFDVINSQVNLRDVTEEIEDLFGMQVRGKGL